jgi:hypothetical protein
MSKAINRILESNRKIPHPVFIHSGVNTKEVLGTAYEVLAFFHCVDYCLKMNVKNKFTFPDVSMVTKKLYSHYISLEETKEFLYQINALYYDFKTIPSNKIKWEKLFYGKNVPVTIDIKKENLCQVFTPIFDKITESCYGSMINDCYNKKFYNEKNIILIYLNVGVYFDYLDYELPRSIDEIGKRGKTFEDYDNLEGSPFWFVAFHEKYSQESLDGKTEIGA